MGLQQAQKDRARGSVLGFACGACGENIRSKGRASKPGRERRRDKQGEATEMSAITATVHDAHARVLACKTGGRAVEKVGERRSPGERGRSAYLLVRYDQRLAAVEGGKCSQLKGAQLLKGVGVSCYIGRATAGTRGTSVRG